jgi:hypothetical protein
MLKSTEKGRKKQGAKDSVDKFQCTMFDVKSESLVKESFSYEELLCPNKRKSSGGKDLLLL